MKRFKTEAMLMLLFPVALVLLGVLAAIIVPWLVG
jgi:hypothetical protein